MNVIMDNDFFDIADTFINLVNEHSQRVGSAKAASALVYASARFNAFMVASNSADLDEMKKVRPEKISNFMASYGECLDSNFSEYENNYEQYLKR